MVSQQQHSAGPCGCAAQMLSRRRVLASLAGAGIAAAIPWRPALAAQTDALLFNCIDFRLTDATTRYMAGRGMAGKYDQLVLAGASLAAQTKKFPAWNETFWQHLKVALDLHHIHEVIVIDHRDCGAYKVVFGEDFSTDPAKEMAVHARELRNLRRKIVARYPKLNVELGLMALDGNVEAVS
ncbi:MAG TPA: carbonic anhydrase [Stellaceae bacterium]|nr:carbonic anhydrase [Stellaceae bacterium]